jgi:hypothetical protein
VELVKVNEHQVLVTGDKQAKIDSLEGLPFI